LWKEGKERCGEAVGTQRGLSSSEVLLAERWLDTSLVLSIYTLGLRRQKTYLVRCEVVRIPERQVRWVTDRTETRFDLQVWAIRSQEAVVWEVWWIKASELWKI
jgi:hypothetical protein